MTYVLVPYPMATSLYRIYGMQINSIQILNLRTIEVSKQALHDIVAVRQKVQ
jgi:hypothetical protein